MNSREENLAMLRKAEREIQPGQRFEVRDFDPEDAPGIAALFFAVYGDKFPVDSVYDPAQIIKDNASGQTNHAVGRTEAGEVVGLHALFRNPPGRRIMEAGSWIVLPAYRNTSLGLKLTQRTLVDWPPRFGLDVVYTQNVCDHIISQKTSAKFGFISCALALEAMPPRPEATQGGDESRISLIDAFMILRDVPHAVRLPEFYADTLRGMYASRGLVREFVPAGEPQGESRCTIQAMDYASLVKMTLDEVGLDVAACLDRLEQDHPDRHVYQLVIPLWLPGVSLAVQAAREAGFFLGGLLPLWDDRDALLMQKLGAPPDYSKVKVFNQEAKDLLEIVAADRESVTRSR